jgi:hypothetical protein
MLYNIRVDTDDYYDGKVRAQLRQVRLCSLVLEGINNNLTEPVTADSKADLVIVSENLLVEVMKLVEQARSIAWNEEPTSIPPNTVI